MNIHKFIKQIQESESFKKFKEQVDEESVTGMVAGYDTPKAFAPQGEEAKDSFDAKTRDNAEQFGYKMVKKEKKRNFESKKSVNEASTTLGFSVMTLGDSFIEGAGDDADSNTYQGYDDDNANLPHPTMRKTVESAGYKSVKRDLRKESAYKAAMKVLHEASYKEYKGDKTKTTSEKINHSIKELNQSLLRVERAVGHALRLKTEMAVDQRSLWRSSHNRLVKIGERLNRIGKKINELGA